MRVYSRFWLSCIVVVVMVTLLAGCSSDVQRDADNAFDGVVSQVWEDGLMLGVDDGRTVIIDTWDVCGDNTARSISTGDRITVYADRDLISYDAWRILDADGQTACETSVASSSATHPTAGWPHRNAVGGFEGTVSRVWSDGLTLDLDDGRSMRIDAWAVCGDNTPRSISTGDRITVYAQRDFFSYDAWRILDADGESVCRGSLLR